MNRLRSIFAATTHFCIMLFSGKISPVDGVYAVFAEHGVAAESGYVGGRTQVFGPDRWRRNFSDAVADLTEARQSKRIYPPSAVICRAFHGKWRQI